MGQGNRLRIHKKTRKNTQKPKKRKNYAYTATLYTQLLNGTRISEAVRAIQEFAKTGKRELNIKLSKKKKQETRLIIIPENIDRKNAYGQEMKMRKNSRKG